MRPYRYDIVGSFLRPDYLKDARAEYAEGTLSADQLREVEDKAIKELVEKEKAVGLKATDQWSALISSTPTKEARKSRCQ